MKTEEEMAEYFKGEYCVYLTYYEGDKLPPFYVGSSSIEKVKAGYRGSVGSKEFRTIWHEEVKTNPHLFRTDIIYWCKTRDAATIKEKELQERLEVVGSDKFVNKALATPNGFCGMNVKGKNNPNYGNRMTAEQKARHSSIMIEIALRPEVKALRSKIQQEIQNTPEAKLKKSVVQKAAWKDENSNLKNSRASQFKPTPIKFTDYEFQSTKEFYTWQKEKYPNKPKLGKQVNYSDWSLLEYPFLLECVTYMESAPKEWNEILFKECHLKYNKSNTKYIRETYGISIPGARKFFLMISKMTGLNFFVRNADKRQVLLNILETRGKQK